MSLLGKDTVSMGIANPLPSVATRYAPLFQESTDIQIASNFMRSLVDVMQHAIAHAFAQTRHGRAGTAA